MPMPGHIGERIRRARARRGFTQYTLADRIGVNQSAVARWETGSRKPRYEHLSDIAKALGLSVARLVEHGT